MHDLLQRPAFRVHATHGDDTLTLPGLMASLIRNDIISMDFVRAHQRHPVHAFLVQLGAIAMYKADLSEPPDDAETWDLMLKALTPEYPDGEPWHLVVRDITKPAFLQPPSNVPGQLRRYRRRSHTPDNLDVLVSSTNHDMKQNIARRAQPDDWIAALITLQTSGGFQWKQVIPGIPHVQRIRKPFCLEPCPGDRHARTTRISRHDGSDSGQASHTRQLSRCLTMAQRSFGQRPGTAIRMRCYRCRSWTPGISRYAVASGW